MRVSSNRSSETRLHLNRAGTVTIVTMNAISRYKVLYRIHGAERSSISDEARFSGISVFVSQLHKLRATSP